MQRLVYNFDGAKNIPCLVWEQLAAMARGEMVKEEVDKEDEEGVEGIIRFDSIGWAWQLPASKRRRGNILKCPILNSFCQKLAGPCLRNWSWTRILYKALSWNTKVDRSSTFISFFKVDISSKLTLKVNSFWNLDISHKGEPQLWKLILKVISSEKNFQTDRNSCCPL